MYPTDLSDLQWHLVAPVIPASRPIGADRTVSMRAVVNAVLYRQRSGCSWRMLPRDLPHWRTVYGYLRQWLADGTWQRVQEMLRRHARRGEPLREEAGAGALLSKHGKIFQEIFCDLEPAPEVP